MQREASESTDLDAVAVGQGRAHLFQYGFHTKLHIQVGEMPLYVGQTINEFRFCHRKTPYPFVLIIILFLNKGG